MELPFIFDPISRYKEMTGGGKDTHVKAGKTHSAWISFTKTRGSDQQNFRHGLHILFKTGQI